jgi:hypothetical protein
LGTPDVRFWCIAGTADDELNVAAVLCVGVADYSFSRSGYLWESEELFGLRNHADLEGSYGRLFIGRVFGGGVAVVGGTSAVIVGGIAGCVVAGLCTGLVIVSAGSGDEHEGQ